MQDEFREIGLNGLYLKNGIYKDIFGLGSYQGYSLVLSYMGTLASYIFENSNLTFRLPSALVSSISVPIFFLSLIAITKNKSAAITGTLIYMSTHFFLHFSRTELVISSAAIFSSMFIASLLLLKKDYRAYFLFGLIFGLAMYAYVAIRPIMLLLGAYLCIGSCEE